MCIISTMDTDALVLKHQGISIHSADLLFLILDKFHTKILHLQQTILETNNTFRTKTTQLSKG